MNKILIAGLAAYLLGLILFSFMTFNVLTPLGSILAGSFLFLYPACALASRRQGRLLWVALAAAILFLVLGALYQFSPPRAKSGVLVDTTIAWKKYSRGSTQ